MEAIYLYCYALVIIGVLILAEAFHVTWRTKRRRRHDD